MRKIIGAFFSAALVTIPVSIADARSSGPRFAAAPHFSAPPRAPMVRPYVPQRQYAQPRSLSPNGLSPNGPQRNYQSGNRYARMPYGTRRTNLPNGVDTQYGRGYDGQGAGGTIRRDAMGRIVRQNGQTGDQRNDQSGRNDSLVSPQTTGASYGAGSSGYGVGYGTGMALGAAGSGAYQAAPNSYNAAACSADGTCSMPVTDQYGNAAYKYCMREAVYDPSTGANVMAYRCHIVSAAPAPTN